MTRDLWVMSSPERAAKPRSSRSPFQGFDDQWRPTQGVALGYLRPPRWGSRDESALGR